MPAASSPSRAALYELIEAVLQTDSDLQAFCAEHFSATASRLSGGMDRLARVNLLLETETAAALVAALQRHDPQRFAEHQHLLGAPVLPSGNPYRGLAAFQLDEAPLFRGREALTEKLWQLYMEIHEQPRGTRVLAIVGPSGAGKSSVARASLLASLDSRTVPGTQALRRVVIQPGEHPLLALADALDIGAQNGLVEELRRPNPQGAFDGLTRWAAGASGASPGTLVVLVDPLEEIYTLCPDKEERDAFVSLLLHAAQDTVRQFSVVLTLRSDFLGEAQRQHPALMRLLAEQAVLVGAMGAEELRRAIVEPAVRTGRAIDEATVDLLLQEAQGIPDSLPLLQFSLTQIWEGMSAGHPAGAVLHQLGGVGSALDRKAQEIYTALSEPQQAMARRTFVRLVQLGEGTRDTRRRVLLRELCGRKDAEADVLSVLRRFATASARLVTLTGEGPDVIAEVTHEALFEHWTELRRWIDEDRETLRFHARAAVAARLWDEAGRPQARLWRPPDLDLLRDYQKRRPDEVSGLQAAFLDAASRQQRRGKLLARGVAVAAALAVFIAGRILFTKERRRTAEASRAGERFRQQLLSTYVERGRRLLFIEQKPQEALLWLHRAQQGGATDPLLPDILRSATQSLRVAKRILRHGDKVQSAISSPDNRRIVTLSGANTARLWDAETGRLVKEIKTGESRVGSAAFSPDSRRFVTATGDKVARVWEAETGRFVTELKGHEESVTDTAYSADGRRILTTGRDDTARVWDAESGRLVVTIKASILSAAFSPDGRRILTTGYYPVRVWDAETGSLVTTLESHSEEEQVVSAAFSPDGSEIVTASDDRTARIWKVDTGAEMAVLVGHRGGVSSAAFSPDGRRILTTSWGEIRLWDSIDHEMVAELKVEGEARAAFSPDGCCVVAAAGNTVRIWEAHAGRLLAELKGHAAGVSSVIYSPDGRRILTASDDRTVRVWDAHSVRFMTELKGNGSVWSAAFSPDGRRIVTASGEKTTRVWEADTGRLVAELKGHAEGVFSATFSPDGRRIVTGSEDRTARVWEADTGRLLAELKGHTDNVGSAVFSPDGCRIVTASRDNTVRIWEADTGRQVAMRELQGPRIWNPDLSPDGRRLVTTIWSSGPRVWEVDTGRLVAEFKGSAEFKRDSDRIVNAALSPDGRYAVTDGWYRPARVWEADTGLLAAELKEHGDYVVNGAFSPDSRRLVIACGDNTGWVWDLDTRRVVAELPGTGDVVNAAFSPDGRRIVTTSLIGSAWVWDMTPETRSAADIAKLLRCYVPLRFEREDTHHLVPTEPVTAECE